MAKMAIKGLDQYAKMLDKLGAEAPEIAKKAVYSGAEVLADEVKRRLTALPEEKMRYLQPGEKFSGVPENQKQDLIDSMGVATISQDENGNTNTKIGFGGYGKHPTKKYPKGLPNALLARSIESGSSVRKKIPFVRAAVNAVKKKAQKAMGDTVEKEISKIYANKIGG